MSIDYDAVTKAWRRNKAALTRARNQRDWAKVVTVCEQAFDDMERWGYPDDWHLFPRAAQDAVTEAHIHNDWALATELQIRVSALQTR